jgi:hypothetical protein
VVVAQRSASMGVTPASLSALGTRRRYCPAAVHLGLSPRRGRVHGVALMARRSAPVIIRMYGSDVSPCAAMACQNNGAAIKSSANSTLT